MKKSITAGMITLAIFSLLLSACSSPGSDAASAIEAYYQALVANDAGQLINASCASWEATAQVELASFAAVEVNLENMSCQISETDGDKTIVRCTGKIIANYGNEILELNLADQSYIAVMEGGEWRMCGYQ